MYECGFNGNPENSSWSTRPCSNCESTGHISDVTPGCLKLLFNFIVIVAIACSLMR